MSTDLPTAPADVDTLPPTQYLVIEVLAARHRLGEPFWTFPTRLDGAVRALEEAGLVWSRPAPTPHARQVELTDVGRAAALYDAYEPPAADGDGQPRVRMVTLPLCELCLSGAGGQCHVPGCAMWMNRAPDLPLSTVPPEPATSRRHVDETEVIHPDLEHDCATCSGDHRPVVPPLAGIPPRCACGWTPHGGYTLADHLRDMAEPATSSEGERDG